MAHEPLRCKSGWCMWEWCLARAWRARSGSTELTACEGRSNHEYGTRKQRRAGKREGRNIIRPRSRNGENSGDSECRRSAAKVRAEIGTASSQTVFRSRSRRKVEPQRVETPHPIAQCFTAAMRT